MKKFPRLSVFLALLAFLSVVFFTATGLSGTLSSWLTGKTPPEFADNGLPSPAAALVEASFGDTPELKAAAERYMLTRQDEVLSAYRKRVWDPKRGERAQASMFCLAARARRLGREVGPQEFRALQAALESVPGYVEGVAVAEAAIPWTRIVSRTHEHEACEAAGLPPAPGAPAPKRRSYSF